MMKQGFLLTQKKSVCHCHFPISISPSLKTMIAKKGVNFRVNLDQKSRLYSRINPVIAALFYGCWVVGKYSVMNNQLAL